MKRKKTAFSSIGAFLLLLVAKLKFVLVFLKIFKLTTIISLLVSLAAYGMVYGWQYGIIVVYLLLIHEMGHVWAMKRLKIPTNPILFIPFIGGLASGKEGPKNAYQSAFIAYMGPVFGFLSIIPAVILYAFTHDNFWILMILTGSVLNLFNLIPMTPLDGGNIIKVINTKILIAGFILGIAAMVMTKSYSFSFFILLGIVSTIVFHYERKYLFKKKEELVRFKELTEYIRDTTNEVENIKVRLENEKDSYLSYLKNSISIALDEFNNENDYEEIRNKVIGMFDEDILDKEKEYSYLDSFLTITKKEKAKVLGVYLLLIVLLGLGTFYGFHLLGDEINSIK